MNIDLFSAFIIGLLGSGHCIGMCGGITTMLTSALPRENLLDSASPAKYSLNKYSNIRLAACYNFGRITSYAFIGAIVGFTGSIAAKNIGVPLAGLRLLAGIFLILLGLYLGQWLMWLSKVERIGKILWKTISPYSKKLIPVNSPQKAIGLGLLWGWLPCGLVYSTLTWSLASGNALSGAAIMACFGLGTLPALMTMSIGAVKFKELVIQPLFRKTMAICIIFYGIYSTFVAYSLLF
ncbi:MAG: sulfite exporter TauE/SafE family protein [Alteromonadaceae bacterium]|nr:sulfite exporter TauE/SafE family protein [Alteromonadaceae bacterium]